MIFLTYIFNTYFLGFSLFVCCCCCCWGFFCFFVFFYDQDVLCNYKTLICRFYFYFNEEIENNVSFSFEQAHSFP